MKIIDGRARLRTETFIKFWDPDHNPAIKDYVEKYHMQDRLKALSVEQLILHANEAGIEKLLIYGSTPEENSRILKLSKEHKELIPVGGVNLKKGISVALEEIIRLKAENIAAIDFSFLCEKNVNDKDFYALYGYCEVHSIPVIIHSGVHFSRSAYLWKAQPQYFDEIAVDFPELKIIMSHGGNGFGPSVLAVTQRHPNIYLEFASMRPKYMAPEFIQAANTYLKDRCIFGTDYPLTDFDNQVKLWQYALREEVWDKFFRQNILSALFEKPVKN
ncbi:MAG: amidohydrolase family protein [Candidatus Marinimicrobia bacterium]|nr:amidohydrolase family protein [Candidatus Neomarinimicrobiota bacterium]